MTTIKRCWVIISTSFILLGSLLRHRVLSLYYNEDRGFFVIFFWRGQRQGKKMPKACSDRSQKNSRCRSSARHGRLPRGSKRRASAQAGGESALEPLSTTKGRAGSGIKKKIHSTTQKHLSNSANIWKSTHKTLRIHTIYNLITF